MVPDAAKRVSTFSGASAWAASCTDTVVPEASAICEARVRCQIIRYNDSSWPFSSARSESGERSGVVGRIASWASWAFFTLVANWRGDGDRYCCP